jgi:MFS family permease
MNYFRNYYVVVAAALCYGTATGQMSMLAPLLKQMALSSAAIGLVLAAVPVGNIPGRIWSAWVVEKIGVRRALCSGALVAALGIVGLGPALCAPVPFISLLAAVAAVTRGVSYSIFNTAGICAVRAHAPPDQHIYAVGLFTATFMASNLWAPAIGEFTLGRFGVNAYLLLAALPMLLAFALTACTIDVPTSSLAKPTGYLTLLRDGRLWLPELVIFCSGLAYGFSTSLLPVYLVEAHIPLACYFTGFGVSLLLNRLVLLKIFQKLAPRWIVAYGLVMSAASMYVLLIRFDAESAVISGVLFGIGYVLHPATVEWTLRLYPNDTVRPVALINTGLGLGMLMSTQIGATFLDMGPSTLIALLCVPVIVTLGFVLGGAAKLRRSRAPADLSADGADQRQSIS